MKKLFKLFLIVATAAASIASCQKPETEVEALEDVEYTFLIGNADDTKATIGETCVVWDDGDEIGTFANGATNKPSTVTAATVEKPASFSIYSKGGLTVGSAVYCYYPYASGSVTSDNVPMSIPTSQTEKNSMPMASAPYTVVQASQVNNTDYYSGEIFFYNLGSVIEFNIYSTTEDYQSENVMSVEFQAEDAIAGSFNFNLTTVDENNLAISGYAEKTVTSSPSTPIQVGADKENAAKVKMVVAPGSHGGEIVITTDRAIYTYSMSEREFGRSRMKPLGINLKEENRVEPDYSGEKLIVGTKAETLYAAKSWVASDDNLKTLEFTFGNDGKVDEAVYPSISDCKMTISKVTAEGNYYGLYTIQDASGKYLYAASSSSNHLKASESKDEGSANNYYWAIMENGGSYYIVAAESLNRNVLRYNTGSNLFSCYEDATKQSPVVLYDYSIKEDTTPRIYVEKNEYEVAAAATSLAVPFTVNKNITEDITVTVEDEGKTMTNVSCGLGENVVNVTFDANNTSDPQTATIILSYEGAPSVEVAITQAGKSNDVWELVTDAANISLGDKIVIVATEYDAALSTNQKSNNRGAVQVTKTGSEVTISDDVQIITVETGTEAGTFAFNTGNGYLYAASSSSNYLRTRETLDGNASWSITIENGVTKIVARGNYTRNMLQYYNSSSLFSCYAEDNPQKSISIYKLVN